MTDTTISRIVMKRVHRIHAIRMAAAPLGGAIVFLIALWSIGREVWVAKVFENMPALLDVPAVLGFYTSAFLGTDLLVQACSVSAAASLIWIASELARHIRVPHRFA
ncbi:MAG: hypothetical protein V4644_01795 [Patescibacteria group bacterium]